MSERHDFIANFTTEHYLVYVDGVEVDKLSAGCWANLEDILQSAEDRLDEKIMAGKTIITRYMNVDKNHIMFWTYKQGEWFTL
jgi:hypothetical protein